MGLLALAETLAGFATRTAATVYFYSSQLLMHVAHFCSSAVNTLIIHPIKTIIWYVVVIPLEIILRNTVELLLLPVNIPLYVLFGSSVSSLYSSFNTNAATFGLMMISQYVLSMLILGFMMGITTGVVLSSFHKLVPIPNVYWEPSLSGLLQYVKKFVFFIYAKLKEETIKVPSSEVSVKRQSHKPVYNTFNNSIADATADAAAPVEVTDSDSDFALDVNNQRTSDVGNLTPLSLPDTSYDTEQDNDTDEEISEMSKYWANDRGYVTDTVRTEMTESLSHLVHRDKAKRGSENLIDIRNLDS
ncbi:unnamed protein product [Kluyveromyces dobzhanskii CBS 2104]|uniref:WGS project CCBQ000000000 data, contig 00107 n=1 Tax=Kluyveromyces dobzhanskii CBS 2104 TaxID=1427455 RepID=A0A0A8KZ00_9SACH|nr:unnamed protein product [Kluyveromyces dobzhanskii CBS 2104]